MRMQTPPDPPAMSSAIRVHAYGRIESSTRPLEWRDSTRDWQCASLDVCMHCAGSFVMACEYCPKRDDAVWEALWPSCHRVSIYYLPRYSTPVALVPGVQGPVWIFGNLGWVKGVAHSVNYSRI